jgi:2-phosphosulfolactate phosphatase
VVTTLDRAAADHIVPSTSGADDFCSQTGAAFRFDWGLDGLRALAPHADVVVIVDVLRFTTAVSAAIEVGATVLPYPWNDEGAPAYAAANGALLAGRRELGELSLSPAGLLAGAEGERLVLPSPNGSALAFASRELGARHVLAGSIRNATATAAHARRLAAEGNGVIALIAAGERWGTVDGPVRHAVEDLLGAGAVLAALDPSAAVGAPHCSPEAAAARAAFVAARPRLHEAIVSSASGRELLDRGWADDVQLAAEHDVSAIAAELHGAAFVAAPAV